MRSLSSCLQSRRCWIRDQQRHEKGRSFRNSTRLNVNRRPNFPSFFGNIGNENQFTLYDLFESDGSLRFSCPCVQRRLPEAKYKSLPIMFFLPGFDGAGVSATHQYPLLTEAFDFMLCTIPIKDRSSFEELLVEVEAFIRKYVCAYGNGRPVYLMGESFGALLGLVTAFRCSDVIDRLILINPATSYKQSIWPLLGPLIPQVPNELYLGVSFALAPLLGNPLALMARGVDFSRPIDQQTYTLFNNILALFGTLGFIGDVFTPETIAHRLKLVQQGVELANPLIPQVPQKTLLITCDGDWMLPSRNERDRLLRLMCRCFSRSMGSRSHALLLEAGINLVDIIKEEGFYVTERNFTVPGYPHQINNFGTTNPIELPTQIERSKAYDFISPVDKVVSPVFYSTTSSDEIVCGFNGVPDQGAILFVGNHQLMGQDTLTLVDTLMREKEFLLRGLVHPIFQLSGKNGVEDRPENLMFMPMNRLQIQNLFSTYGAVPVSAKNLHSLLKQGEKVLLYPGGAREVFKLKDEKYQLFWPETAEFVRTAAKFEATIVTVAAVGLEDWIDIVLDREEILQTPILKKIAQNQLKSSPEARPGVSNTAGDVFLSPLVIPKVPSRHYFLFGKPFKTDFQLYKDKRESQKLYQQIQSQLKQNLAYLQEKAKEDPYGNFLKRIIYENGILGKQAPSFEP